MGAQASREQFDKILSYMEIGRGEGAKMLLGGGPAKVSGLEWGLLHPAHHLLRPEQDAGVPGGDLRAGARVTTFKDEADALAIANDTQYGLGAGLWTRDSNLAWHGARHPGRPGLGQLLPRLPGPCGLWRLQEVGDRSRDPQDDAGPLPENTKNLLVSHDINPLGFLTGPSRGDPQASACGRAPFSCGSGHGLAQLLAIALGAQPCSRWNMAMKAEVEA